MKSQHGPTKNMLGQTNHIFFIQGVDWQKRGILAATSFGFRNVLMGIIKINLGIREKFELFDEAGAAKVEAQKGDVI